MTKASLFKDKNVLITGGSGSFGQAFARRLLTENEVNKVIIFSNDEWQQWEMQQSEKIFNHPKIRYFLGDVRDDKRLHRAFNEVHIIIHAAALKQVPAAEYNPTEFVQTNIIGAVNVIDAAIDARVEKVIALSSDKAVNPINLYGATKLCSDKLFTASNAYVGATKTPLISVVRYGNVLGTRGSILPLWNRLIADGATYLPITDERMTRFWITLDQGIDLVIAALGKMEGGEIFVPKIPSIRITDLAKAVAQHLPIKVIGIREGEKIHEMMVSEEDARHAVEWGNNFIIFPSNTKRMEEFVTKTNAKRLPDDFTYASNTNTHWLTVDELRTLIGL